MHLCRSRDKSQHKNKEKSQTYQIQVTGLIQGVGFRPFIYRLANSYGLKGEVSNHNKGVLIVACGDKLRVDLFIEAIKRESPKAAIVEKIEIQNITNREYEGFTIGDSKTIDNSVTIVSPDIAVCEECLEDMKLQPNRLDYPFTNCTNCGPRYSIIEEIPYDRKHTSMKAFNMCPHCSKEYHDIEDRRFHAQPVACNNCGPGYQLHTLQGTFKDIKKILEHLTSQLNQDNVVAIKGLGGYHLACNAISKTAIEKLRSVKARDSKPFAIMVKDIASAKEIAHISETEESLLVSWQRPIVLVQAKDTGFFSKDVACSLKTLGLFLPYMPFHHQLFNYSGYDHLIMTSANLSECPIIIEDKLAIQTFLPQGVPVLEHNREVVNRTDDSVVIEIASKKQIIRRSRGYVPIPVNTKLETEGILATGAELNGAFCLGKGRQGILSPYIGDIKNFETMHFYEQTYQRLIKLFKFEPAVIACDMHPDYQSSHFADQFGLPIHKIQHHHAHIASCMAEYGLDEQVIGISYDGTGYGTDGKIWGSEIMVADLSDFERKYHFGYVQIPGGDKASKEPWRSGLGYLKTAWNDIDNESLFSVFTRNLNQGQKVQREKIKMALNAIEYKINSPESCSAGRLFDAIASITGICTYSTYHAEAPILLENSIQPGIYDTYPILLNQTIDWAPVIKEVVEDIHNGTPPGVVSARFHNTVATITHQAIIRINIETGINKVVLSGGTFQNKYLTNKIVELISESGMQPYVSSQVPCNDGGIALGQLAVASKKLKSCV